MPSPASSSSELRACLSADQALADAVVTEVRADRARLPVVFPGLPRRSGRTPIGGGRRTLGGALIDLDAFRRCDLVAAYLLSTIAVTDDEAVDLYAHGDIEERAMLLRALHLLPVGPLTARLFGEMQRTNVVLHLEAAVCDGDLFARAVGSVPAERGGFDRAAANRLLLKIAFLDLPLARVLGAERHANVELSRMLQDLATEREAAGRSVWRDTWRLIGRAPCDGTTARLIGGLEHGDDGVRLAAAEGLLALGRPELAVFAKERLPRELREPIRAVLRRLVEPR